MFSWALGEDKKKLAVLIVYGEDAEAKYEECKTALEHKYGDKITVTGEKGEGADGKFEIKLNDEVIYDEGPPSEEKMQGIYDKLDAACKGGSASGSGASKGSENTGAAQGTGSTGGTGAGGTGAGGTGSAGGTGAAGGTGGGGSGGAEVSGGAGASGGKEDKGSNTGG